MRLSRKYAWIGRRREPRTEFLGLGTISWLGELAKETNAGLTVCHALVQHFYVY